MRVQRVLEVVIFFIFVDNFLLWDLASEPFLLYLCRERYL